MKTLRSRVAVAAVTALVPAWLHGEDTIATWTSWQHTFTSQGRYTNPYADVVLRVTYEGPGGQRFDGFGFWDGADTFRIRTLFPAAGNWTWRTDCSDASDAGLHGRRGTVRVAPYSGANPLSRRGHLRVSADKRHLIHADGTPFLWIGDTAWNASTWATAADWETYVRDRALKKFTVVHLSARAGRRGYTDADGNPAFVGNGLERWNPAFWLGFERKIHAANEQGLVVLVVGIAVPLDSRTVPPEPDARRYARQLAARMAGSFVVFSPGFDEDEFGGLTEERITQVGDEIRQTAPLHLLTNHPNPDEPYNDKLYSDRYRDKSFVDFAGLQSGRGHRRGRPGIMTAELCAQIAIERCLALYARHPEKPLINLEARYDSPFTQRELPRLPRSCGYWSLLSGSAGYSYGNDAIWTWGHWRATPPLDYAVPWTWQEGMNQRSSTEMTHLAEFFSGLAWWRLVPAHDLIQNQPTEWTRRMALARTTSGDLAVAYLPDNDEVLLDLSGFPASLRAQWFNPVTGASHAHASTLPNSPAVAIRRPSPGDWLLTLTPAAPLHR